MSKPENHTHPTKEDYRRVITSPGTESQIFATVTETLAETLVESLSSGYEKLTSSISHAGHYLAEKIGLPQTLNIETGNMRLKYTHPTYTFVDDPSEADGVAWAFVDHFTAGEFLFKFPAIKPDEIRIDVTYFGICHSDTMFMQEELIPIKKYPCAPGHEIVGRVTAIGSHVKNFKLGERVGFGFQRWCCGKCRECLLHSENICSTPCDQKWVYGDLYWGGYATAMQQPADFFFKLPDTIDVPEEKLPGLFCSGVTVFAAMERHVKKGDRVAVLGIGGLGHMALQYLKAWGCKVGAFTRTTSKIEEIKKLGDFEIFDTNNLEVFEQQKGKYDVVFQCLPVADNQYVSQEFELLDSFGKFVMLGLPSMKEQMMINILPLHLKHISIHFNFWATRKQVRDTIEFSVKHNIWPVVEVWDFDNLPKAYNQVLSSRPIFKGVVKAIGYLEGFRKVY